MKTFHAKPQTTERDWVVIDAKDQILGRLSTRIATLLRGKHRPDYTPHCDVGDFVVVVNAEKVRVTGGKEFKKTYFTHTGYPGGERKTVYAELMAKHPERIIERAVRGMLPRTRLGRKQIRKLKVYVGPDHPHQAQQPTTVTL